MEFGAGFKGQDLSKLESQSDLFEGKKFRQWCMRTHSRTVDSLPLVDVIMASGAKQKYPKQDVERMYVSRLS